MFFTMIVTLFTSRVILQKLGVDDYGIFQAVGGIVGFLSFINGALATGASRFLTYAIGEDNYEKLKRTFSTTLLVHLLIAIVVVLIAETIGLWFLYHKMVIAPERMHAAVVVFHLSVITAVFALLQVPYHADIIAHEKMGIYATLSIIDASAKLFVCYILAIGHYDRLIFYVFLLLCVQVLMTCMYGICCLRSFPESKCSFVFDKNIFLEIAGFSGWSLFSNLAIALNNQGVLILLNMFFSPAIVAARAISLQVNSAANQFVTNFRQAANPQIVKKYAAGDFEGSKHLLLESTKYSYYMMLALSLPICILAEPLMRLWLGVVPEYAVPFLQLVIIQSLFQVFDTSFYTALYAKGRLKENALISPLFLYLLFPIIYFFFKMGFSPLSLSYGALACYFLLGCIVKPIMIVKIVDYTWIDIWNMFKPCIKVTLASIPLPIFLAMNLDLQRLPSFFIIALVCLFCIGISVWYFGLNREIRHGATEVLITKLKKI